MDAARIIEAESRKYPGDDRPVFIGQAPSKAGDPSRPLTGLVGQRLARLASMVPMEFYLSVVRANIIPEFAGRRGTTDVFPMAEARANAERAAPLLDGRTAVFVGRKVADAFGCKSEWFEWGEEYITVDGGVARVRYATIPHPSGRNRFWNFPENVREARRFMTELMSRESSLPQLRMLRERARAIGEKKLGKRATKTSLRGVVSGSGADRLQEQHRGAGEGGPAQLRVG